MKILILVETGETQSATITQDGHDAVTVNPGQNAAVEVLSTHTISISTDAPEGEAEPDVPAAPVVANVPAAPPPLAADVSNQGDTGAKVIPDGSPPELQAVSNAVDAVNSTVAQVNVAQADAVEAAQGSATANGLSLPGDATDDQKAALAQQQEDAAAAAKTAADAHTDAVAAADVALDAAKAAQDALASAAADPASAVTDDHAAAGAALVDGAQAAVDGLQSLDTAISGAGGEPWSGAEDDPGRDTGIVGAIPADLQPVEAGTTAAVLSTDPAHGATDDAPVILTVDPASPAEAAPIVLATPVTGDVVPGSIVVQSDGTPIVDTSLVTTDAPAPALGDTAPAPEGTPTPPNAGGTAVGALTSDDGATPAPNPDIGDSTGLIPITEEHAAAAADAPAPSNETIVAIIKALEATDLDFTAEGFVSIDHLNAALVAQGFSTIDAATASAASF